MVRVHLFEIPAALEGPFNSLRSVNLIRVVIFFLFFSFKTFTVSLVTGGMGEDWILQPDIFG